jgi:NADH-quinone oxidoreductase subunit G
MTRIVVDGTSYEVADRQNLLAACLGAGLDLPYFCWHPAMGSVGACRQCAVKQFKNEDDRHGRLVMACMTPALEGARISIADSDAKTFRASVIEWLMVNHPHDCPVCDEGGECHLQDMTVMTGHAYRRYRYPKRTYRNQELGPFIKHDMNRCIQCYRCVRFYRDYAGGRDLNVFGSHDAVYFGRERDGTLENEFSGNLVEVCPTGVFVDKTLFHHYSRKWDLQSAQSICPHCSLGCNTTPGERYGILRRVVNRYNGHVNGYFLCDRGRFGYGYVNDDRRIRRALHRASRGGPARPEGVPHVLSAAADLLRRARGVVGIGSPRASLESNVALRALVGPERFVLGIGEAQRRCLSTMLTALRAGPVPSASLREAEESDAVLVLDVDLLNEAPRLALALLQSVRQQPMERLDELKIFRWDDAAVRNALQERRGPLFLAGHRRTWLHDYATEGYFAAPEDIARLGFAVAHAIDQTAPPVADVSEDVRRLASRIALSLAEARRPLVVGGAGAGSPATIEAAANVAWALHRRGTECRVAFVAPECNSLGLALLGGGTLESACEAMGKGEVDTAIIVENDLYRRTDQARVDAFLRAARGVIVVDSIEHRTVERADVILPGSTVPESDGTVVNQEGRAQRFYQVFVPEGDVAESWRWVRELARTVNQSLSPDAETMGGLAAWRDFDDALAAAAAAAPELARIVEAAPSAGLRMVGQKIPRQPERYSGRTAMLSHLTVHEPPPPPDPDTPLAFSMEGYRGPAPSPVISQFWSPGWNSVQAVNKYQQEIGGPLRDERPGVRLIEPAAAHPRFWFTGVPRAFQPRSGQWLLLPMPEIFGSDELSNLSPAVAERMPEPFISLHPSDAAALGLENGVTIEVALRGSPQRVVVRLDASTPIGTAGLSLVGAVRPDSPPAWVNLADAVKAGRRAA